MNEPLSEDELKALFAAQRAADRERAPEFRDLRGRAAVRTEPWRFPWRWLR